MEKEKGNLNNNNSDEQKHLHNTDNEKTEMNTEVTTKEKQPEKNEPGQQEHADSHEKDDGKKKHKKDKKDVVIEELTGKFEELTDRHLRLQAEFDNFRKRTLREKAELIKSGGESVLISILPVIDDFERAIGSMKDIPDSDAGKQGTILIYNKFTDFLRQNNVKEIQAIHQDFDVDLHEAITKVPAPDEKLRGKVVDVLQKGYLLNEKVIRFARVVIGE